MRPKVRDFGGIDLGNKDFWMIPETKNVDWNGLFKIENAEIIHYLSLKGAYFDGHAPTYELAYGGSGRGNGSGGRGKNWRCCYQMLKALLIREIIQSRDVLQQEISFPFHLPSRSLTCNSCPVHSREASRDSRKHLWLTSMKQESDNYIKTKNLLII